MNVSRENLDDLNLVIRIDVVESDYAEGVNKELKNIHKSASVRGFRKGMAPMGLIERMYKSDVVAREVDDIISQSLFKYISDEKLDIMGYPMANMEKTKKYDFNTDKEFSFFFDAALQPQVELAWDKVNAKLFKVKLTDDDLDQQIKEMRQRYGKFEAPETCGENDFIYGKAVELDADGNVKEGGVDTFISFELATIKNHDEIAPLFVGKKADDEVVFNAAKAFNPTEIERQMRISAEAAQSFASDMKITISGFSRMTPCELNEEFFKKVFPKQDIKDEAAFRKALLKDMEEAYGQQTDILYANDVRKQLIDNFSAEIPEAFLKRWILSRNEKDLTPEKLDAEWNENYLPGIKWELIDGALEKISPIEPSDKEILEEVKKILRDNNADGNRTEEDIENAAKSIVSDKNNVRNIVDRLATEKAVAIFKAQLKPRAKSISIEEYKEKIK